MKKLIFALLIFVGINFININASGTFSPLASGQSNDGHEYIEMVGTEVYTYYEGWAGSGAIITKKNGVYYASSGGSGYCTIKKNPYKTFKKKDVRKYPYFCVMHDYYGNPNYVFIPNFL